jgi:glycosyltransferase involved in cell wall biosynthesis
LTPLISIITINYNDAAGLERTIQSIVSQTYADFEYLVIDGNSTDGSKEVIKRYADKIAYTISEPDSGIYNAMNKGIAQAKGKYLLFINSGDELLDAESLTTVQTFIGGEDLVYFDLILRSPNGSSEIKYYPDNLSFLHFVGSSLPHPATFIKRELFDRFGNYNEALKIISDWAFFITVVCKYQVSYKHIPKVFSVFNLEGISSDMNNRKRIEEEKKQVIRDVFPLFESAYENLVEAKMLKQIFTSSRLIKIFRALGFLKQS